MKNIAIIGGGANGISTFIELFIQIVTAKLQNKVSITLIEKDEKLGYGLAFGTPQPGHILNTQANLMGIFANEPAHFADWLKINGEKHRADIKVDHDMDNAYTTRMLYGDYIAEQANTYLKRAKKHHLSVKVIHSEAIDIIKEKNEYELTFADQTSLKANYIVLALGTPKPSTFKSLIQFPAYLDFPWPTSRIKEKIPSNSHVGVLGTSLSAIDCVMTLLDNGHKGKISLFSPDGSLPRAQPIEQGEYERKHLTLENIHKIKRKSLSKPQVKTLIRLFMKEVEHYEGQPVDWKSLDRTDKSPKDLLEWDIACAEKGGDALMNVAYSLRYDSSTIWSWMDTDQKVLFKKWVGGQWAINRHPTPLHNAKKLLRLFQKGQLNVHSMKSPDAVTPVGSGFSIMTDKEEVIEPAFLINATGSSSALENMDGALIQNLLQREYLSPYAVGGALINERTMQVISPNGGDGIYAVGHLANGLLMDVNAVWYNVRTIGTLVKDLVFRLQEKGA
ncbi:FAD/NAD(P)-binding protein [Echinicola sp. 20G]|uniref:FAD/NAD(P)-binding protein n=1 Tax=Echinicola sp. 20G TaxID=2781961 RepID=UPI00191050A4|nr:FAD/NAD(P)-binding protein [Echinicola sp. 20G]